MRGHMDGWHRCISLVPLPKTSTQKQWSSGQTDSGQTRWRGTGGNEPLKGWAQWAKISGKEPPSSPEIPANLRERKIPPGNVSRMKYWKTFSYRANTPSHMIQNHFTWLHWPWARQNKEMFLSRPLTCVTLKSKIIFMHPDSSLAKFSRGSSLSSLSVIFYFFKLFCCCYKTIRLTDSNFHQRTERIENRNALKATVALGWHISPHHTDAPNTRTFC